MNDTPRHLLALPSQADVVVVGAGLGGLTAATLIARRGLTVVVLDGASPGGRARSDNVEGETVNRGPHALFDHGEAQRILRGLGVSWTGHPAPTGQGGLRVDDRIVDLPSGTVGTLVARWLGLREKVALGRFMTQIGRGGPSEVSAADWYRSRGLAGRALDLVTMLTRVSTYCSDLDALSADAAASQLVLGLRGVTYLDDGWQGLVDRLGRVCRESGVQIVDHCAATAVDDSPGGWTVSTPLGDIACRAVVMAAGGPAEVARLIGHRPWDDVGEPVTAACLDVVVDGPARWPALFSLDHPLYLSTHSASIVHVARYGTRAPDLDRPALVAHAAAAGLDLESARSSRFLARMVVAHSAPQPRAGGLAGRPAVLVPDRPGLLLVGDWVGERGMLADASLASAEHAAAACCAFTGAG